MKKKNFILLFASALVLGFTACGSDDEDNGGGTPNPDPTPNPTETPASLKGSSYYLVALDSESAKTIETKVVKDYRPDVVPDNHLYLWAGYVDGSVVGPNSFGVTEGWTALKVGPGAGWSGCGFIVKNDLDATIKSDLRGITADHYLHFAIKSKDTATHNIIFTDDSKTEVRLGIGAVGKELEAAPIYADFKRDGEWHVIEIAMKDVFAKGLKYQNPSNENIVAFLSGAVEGTELSVDAIFFYKK